MHDEIPIADIKKTLGFPRNDGKNPKNTLQILKLVFQTLRKHYGFRETMENFKNMFKF